MLVYFSSYYIIPVGEHPRIGALDVCPFIPVRSVAMADCVKCSNEFGQLLAETFNVPVYLYEESSSNDYRKSLPQIRSGEYEKLQDKVLLIYRGLLYESYSKRSFYNVIKISMY